MSRQVAVTLTVGHAALYLYRKNEETKEFIKDRFDNAFQKIYADHFYPQHYTYDDVYVANRMDKYLEIHQMEKQLYVNSLESPFIQSIVEYLPWLPRWLSITSVEKRVTYWHIIDVKIRMMERELAIKNAAVVSLLKLRNFLT